jgi:hypothetical protein
MECDADRIIVKKLRINDHTAVNQTDFRYVDWEDVDISGLSISEDQISHFWEIVNYTRNTILYDAKFGKLDQSQVQDVIFKELKAPSSEYLVQTKLADTGFDIFISYAAEEKQSYAFPVYRAIRKLSIAYGVWIDAENLKIGDKLRKEIESVIRYSKLIIIIYSDHYARKGWTRYELYRILQESKERKVKVITIHIGEGESTLDDYNQLCQIIPKENQFVTIDDPNLMNRIAKKVNEVLVKKEENHGAKEF